jgi:beta-lactamase regulating signal transducer with metallopeptidase domain
MNVLVEAINRWSTSWADAMWAVAWQSAVIVAIVALVSWALRWQAPALRYWLWVVLAAKLLLMPLWRVELTTPSWLVDGERHLPRATSVAGAELPDTSSASVNMPAVERIAHHSTATAPVVASRQVTATWGTWLFGIWVAVIVLEIVRVARQYRALRRLLKDSREVDRSVAILVGQCAEAIGLHRPPTVRQIGVDGSPMVCGVCKPVLVLPEQLTDDFDYDALRQIVLHELAHLKRRDLLTVWVLHAMRTVYWFHPASHWIAYRAGLDRELACDQMAMTHSGVSVVAYAHTLIDAAGRAAQPMVLNAAIAARLDGGAAIRFESHSK